MIVVVVVYHKLLEQQISLSIMANYWKYTLVGNLFRGFRNIAAGLVKALWSWDDSKCNNSVIPIWDCYLITLLPAKLKSFFNILLINDHYYVNIWLHKYIHPVPAAYRADDTKWKHGVK